MKQKKMSDIFKEMGRIRGRSSDYKFRFVNECKMYFFNKYHVLFSFKKKDTECKKLII